MKCKSSRPTSETSTGSLTRLAPGKRVTEAVLNTFVKQVSGTTLGIAKPRLLVRLVVHELERARQRDTSYRPPDDITQRLIQLESS